MINNQPKDIDTKDEGAIEHQGKPQISRLNSHQDDANGQKAAVRDESEGAVLHQRP